jgi:hypothetical protein
MALAVDEQDVYPGIAERIRISFDGEIDGEAVAVELVEAGLGAEPEKAVAVAGDGEYGVLGESALDGQGAEQEVGSGLGVERGWKEGEKEEEGEEEED